MKTAARVATAGETLACERVTIEAGTSSAELMKRAGERAATEIALAYPDVSSTPVVVFAGSGNNGGDGWVIAGSLSTRGFDVRVVEVGRPRSEESQLAKKDALGAGVQTRPSSDRNDGPLVIDALLGTGASGAPRGEVAAAIQEIERRSAAGAHVISVDLPSGLDATTGKYEQVVKARRTITFGTVKRGQLISRDVCGEISVVGIGLLENEMSQGLPILLDRAWVHERVPSIPASAHKGTRKSLAIVGGGKGMAGATILSGEGALRSGIGLLRIVAAETSALPVHAALPAAIFQRWPETPSELSKLVSAVDAVAIGPGLGASTDTRDLVERILLAHKGPAVIDADALNVFAGDIESLATLLGGRAAVITPHPAEMGRLLSVSTSEVLDNRFDIGTELSSQLGAAVLLKGTPTIVFSPDGARFVSAAGTAALATGGSGDVLTGIVATLVAQMCSGSSPSAPAEAASCGAFIHGRAAELCHVVRGTTLDDVIRALPSAWNETEQPRRADLIASLGSFS